MELNLILTVDEAQQVLNVLAKEPYLQVVDVINKIQEQSSKQLKKQE